MTLRCIHILLPAALCAGQVCAQSIVRGIVNDGQQKAVGQANVLILQARDSVMVKGQAADEKGQFTFESIPPGDYLLRISSAGFEDLFLPLKAGSGGVDLGKLQMTAAMVQLNDVKVVARKPLFEQKADRMVVNVKNSITSAGNTVLEVIEKSPGVLVDRLNNTLSIAGKNGVTIMINGKITNMPISAIVQLLAGMSAANVEKIELITTPPANFDAEGNAGFINIVFINNPFQGMNGSATLSGGYGEGDAVSASINFNYRNKNLNLYGDYSFLRENRYQVFTNHRKVTDNGTEKETYSYSDRDALQRNHNARLGFDYQLTRKTVVGMLIAGYDNRWTMDAVNTINRWNDGLTDTSLSIPNHEINHWKHLMGNANMQHTISEGETISFDLNYLWYNDDNPTDYTNHYFDKSGGFLFTERMRSTKLTPINTWVGSTDYKRKLGKKANLEAGLKYAAFRFTNDIAVENYQNNDWVPDASLTAKYDLKENVAAGYATVDVPLSEKSSLKAGLRYEYTTTLLGDEKQPGIVDRKYGRLFPSVFFSRKINDENSYNAAYSRRISRPSLRDLAPFVIFMDPNTFFSGNSNLRPAIQDAIKFDFIHKEFVFSLGYSYEANTIVPFQATVDVKTNRQYMQAQNLDNTQSISLITTLPFTVAKWWKMYNNITVIGQQIEVDFDGHPTTVRALMLGVVSTHTFTLPKSYSVEMSVNYDSPGSWGMYRASAFTFVNVGGQKKFKNNSTLRLNLSDVFSSLRFIATLDRPEQHFYTQTRIDFSRRLLSLTYTRPFGKREVKEKRNRSTGSEEETRRVQ